jgi:hypothetical protein
VLERLNTFLPEGQRGKLIAQVYEGAAVMRGATGGVQRKVKDVYGSAHYVHCYAHQLNLIMQQATSHITKVCAFFSDLGGFAAFFSRSSKRTAVLDKMVAHRLPRAGLLNWRPLRDFLPALGVKCSYYILLMKKYIQKRMNISPHLIFVRLSGVGSNK